MTGIEIQYLLGIYFIVSTISTTPERRFNYDVVRLIAGIVLVILAVVGFSLI